MERPWARSRTVGFDLWARTFWAVTVAVTQSRPALTRGFSKHFWKSALLMPITCERRSATASAKSRGHHTYRPTPDQVMSASATSAWMPRPTWGPRRRDHPTFAGLDRGRLVALVLNKLHVAELENARQDAPHLLGLVGGKADGIHGVLARVTRHRSSHDMPSSSSWLARARYTVPSLLAPRRTRVSPNSLALSTPSMIDSPSRYL